MLRISSTVRKTQGPLSVVYTVEGNLEKLLIPERRQPRIAERLWQHTCCEMFVARKGAAAYHEFNFSPSGEWAAYAFADYRARPAEARASFLDAIAAEIESLGDALVARATAEYMQWQKELDHLRSRMLARK